MPPYQPASAELDAYSGLSSTGLVVRTGAGAVMTRTVTAGAGVSVSHGDGVSGDPTVSLSHLGLQSLTDPNADRLLAWDDSGGATAWMSLGTGLAITGTTLDLTVALSSISGLTPASNKIAYYTGSGAAALTDLTADGRSLIGQTTLTGMKTLLGLGASGNPQFSSVEIGHASDTTLLRHSAGNLSVEGALIYRAGGADVPVSDGGTGASTAIGALDNFAQANVWTNIAAASTTDIGAAASTRLNVTGTATINSFGTAAEGTERLLRFASQLVITHSANIVLQNGGLNMIVPAGSLLRTISRGSGVWEVVDARHFNVVAMRSRIGASGALPYAYVIGDDHGTESPGFAVDGGYSQTKTVAKSLITGDFGDTPEIYHRIAGGSPSSPSARSAPYPGAYEYSLAYDGSDFASDNFNGTTITGRNVELSFAITGNPTGTSRPGAFVVGVCPTDYQTPFQRFWVSRTGNAVFAGRSVLEDDPSPLSYPYTTSGLDLDEYTAPYGRTNGVTYYQCNGWGNVSIPASDKTNNAAIAIRKHSDTAAGVDFGYDISNDELQLGTVSGGSRTWRWAWDRADGHYLPVSDGTQNIGSNSRMVADLYARRASISRTTNNDVVTLTAEHTSFSSDMARLRAARTADSGFFFLHCQSDYDGTPDDEIILRGDGQILVDQTITTGGAGFGEYFEWADGNPDGEDRVGWSVVLDEDKPWCIRKAHALDNPDRIIGVVSGRPTVAGNAAWNFWWKKYLLDGFGRPIMETVEVLEWDEIETEEVEVPHQEVVWEEVEEARTETVVNEIPRERPVQRGGKWYMETFIEKEIRERPVTQTVTTECGRVVKVPVMHTVRKKRIEHNVTIETREKSRIRHSYAIDRIPEGVSPPENATRTTITRKALNPDFDPNIAYSSREERPEWAVVSMLGQEYVRAEALKPQRWIKTRDTAKGLEEWLVR